MKIPSKFHTFVDGIIAAGKVTAERLNKNADALYEMFDPAKEGLGEVNVHADAKIVVSDRNYTSTKKITGNWEFQTCPDLPDTSIPDAKLSANVPLKNAANSFSAQQVLLAGANFNLNPAQNIVIERVASLPTWSTTFIGRILYNEHDNNFYGGKTGVGFVQLDYIGGYTGGAIRSYSSGGELDDGNSWKVYFKTEGASPTVKIVLKGEEFPARHYKELPYHTHAFTGVAHTHTLNDAGHFHTVTLGSHGHGSTQYSTGGHTHTVSGNTGTDSANHTHGYSGWTGDTDIDHVHGNIQAGGSYSGYMSVNNPHKHSIQFDTGGVSASHHHSLSLTSGSPSASQAIAAENLGDKNTDGKTTGITAANATAGGSNAHAGVSIGAALATVRKLYGKQLVVKIDGTDITNNIKAAKSWSHIGDGTSGHAFHTAGTGELDVSAWLSYSPGLHTLEISEPETGFGCSVMAHIETT